MRARFEQKYDDVVEDYLAASADQRMQEAEADYEDVVENRRTVENRTRRSGLNMFQEGNRVNPGGRPKTKLIAAAMRRLLNAPDPNDPAHRTNAELIAAALIREAIAGDIAAARELREVTEGKVPNKVEVGEPGDFDLDHLWEDATEEELDAIVAEHLERTLARRSESSIGRDSCSSGGDQGCEEGAQGSGLSYEEA